MKNKIFLIIFCLFFVTNIQAQKKSQPSILLVNGTAHLGNGEVINKSAIGVRDGKIVMVVNALVTKYDVSKFDTLIDISGKHVYPGIIGTNNTIGLTEIEAVHATSDFNETGLYNPNVRTLISYNTDSKVIPTVKTNGVLLVQCTPRGGVLSGTSTVFSTVGWNWEDAVVKADDGVHLNWPRYYTFSPTKPNPAVPGANSITPYQKQIEDLKKFLIEAKAYSLIGNPSEKDLRFEAMRAVFAGKANLYVHANMAKEIIDAVNLCRELSINKPVLVGGYDAWRLVDLLKENKFSVMLGRTHDLPMREDDPIDMHYKSVALLQKAGILFCIQNEGDQEATNLRNLPFQAGSCVPYGITNEQALTSITLSPAKILGIDKNYGSLEAGKMASLFVSSGDALDMKTNKVEIILINGAFSSTTNHQDDLYKKYTIKYSKEK